MTDPIKTGVPASPATRRSRVLGDVLHLPAHAPEPRRDGQHVEGSHQSRTTSSCDIARPVSRLPEESNHCRGAVDIATPTPAQHPPLDNFSPRFEGPAVSGNHDRHGQHIYGSVHKAQRKRWARVVGRAGWRAGGAGSRSRRADCGIWGTSMMRAAGRVSRSVTRSTGPAIGPP